MVLFVDWSKCLIYKIRFVSFTAFLMGVVKKGTLKTAKRTGFLTTLLSDSSYLTGALLFVLLRISRLAHSFALLTYLCVKERHGSCGNL